MLLLNTVVVEIFPSGVVSDKASPSFALVTNGPFRNTCNMSDTVTY